MKTKIKISLQFKYDFDKNFDSIFNFNPNFI